MENVFVYGTLKSGGAIRGLDQFDGATIVGIARTKYPDFDMVDLGAFPAVTDGKSFIKGEVWAINDEVMETLDAIEGYPTFYNRKLIITTEGKAWIYFIPNAKTYKSHNSEESNQIIKEDNILSWRT